jgi:hypothetical protein
MYVLTALGKIGRMLLGRILCPMTENSTHKIRYNNTLSEEPNI